MGIFDPVEVLSYYHRALLHPSCFRVQHASPAFDVGANWVPPSNIDTKHVKYSPQFALLSRRVATTPHLLRHAWGIVWPRSRSETPLRFPFFFFFFHLVFFAPLLLAIRILPLRQTILIFVYLFTFIYLFIYLFIYFVKISLFPELYTLLS